MVRELNADRFWMKLILFMLRFSSVKLRHSATPSIDVRWFWDKFKLLNRVRP